MKIYLTTLQWDGVNRTDSVLNWKTGRIGVTYTMDGSSVTVTDEDCSLVTVAVPKY